METRSLLTVTGRGKPKKTTQAPRILKRKGRKPAARKKGKGPRGGESQAGPLVMDNGDTLSTSDAAMRKRGNGKKKRKKNQGRENWKKAEGQGELELGRVGKG